MAKRHNEYSRLLGTVENGTAPALPPANVPSLTGIADAIESDAQWHFENTQHHAEVIRKLGENQPDFSGRPGGE